MYVLQTNDEEPASQVYADYKDRWSIETYHNYIKNDTDFNALKMQDYDVQKRFDFIILVTGLIHSSLNGVVRQIICRRKVRVFSDGTGVIHEPHQIIFRS